MRLETWWCRASVGADWSPRVRRRFGDVTLAVVGSRKKCAEHGAADVTLDRGPRRWPEVPFADITTDLAERRF